MTKQTNRAKSWGTAIAGLIAALIGIYLAIRAFAGVYQRLNEKNSGSLMEIAWSADWNLATALTHTESDLEYFISSGAEEEKLFLSEENKAALREHFNGFPLKKLGLVSDIVGIDGEEIKFCTNDRAKGEYAFPFGCLLDKPCLCTHGEENYLAIAEKSENSSLKYAALLNLDRLYIHVAGANLTPEYWLVLYDTTTELLLQNNNYYPQVEKRSPDELMGKNDGVSFLLESEFSGVSGITAYKYRYEYPGEEKEISANIATLSTADNRNGVFAVGVAVDASETRAMINQFMMSVVFSTLLVLCGVSVLLVILYRDRRTTIEIKERAQLLEMKNANMQKMIDLAHLQRLELIGSMTSGIAHEFNNLLTPIMSYSILTMEKLPEENNELMDNLSEIYEASRRAKSLISQISALSQKSSGENYSLCSPDELVKKVLATALPSKPRDVSVETVLACPDACLYVNNTQISQLLLNLVLNAYQAMECCGSILRISTRKENDCVHFIVTDNGPGIEQEVMSRIFEPFFTTKESGRGTGLGLAIAQRIAEEYEGCIEVKSVPGMGCEFRVILPLKDREK